MRFAKMYGVRRAVFKALGRLRAPAFLPARKKGSDTAVIGCGQYAFATIGFFVWKHHGLRFRSVFDIDSDAAQTFSRFYRCSVVHDWRDILRDDKIKYVYIASNHASHSDYAAEALEAGKSVYVEKPIAVSFQQLHRLESAVKSTAGCIRAGFNRPVSKMLMKIREHFPPEETPITLSCYVTGHHIPQDHWYRKPQEGTRICGNIAHWIDLFVHIASWNKLEDRWEISVNWSDDSVRDDNLAIVLTSDRGDLINIVLTSRAEPFEGINETINLQCGALIAKIDDFRSATIWRDAEHKTYKCWPKDVGHENAILSLYGTELRAWREVVYSALLTLAIKEMVERRERFRLFSFSGSAVDN